MRKIILSLIINGVALYGASAFLTSHIVAEGGFKLYAIAAVVVGLLNVLVKPLIKILSFPFIFITGGLFLIVINGIILGLMEYLLGVLDFGGINFEIIGLPGYLYAAIIFGLINWFQHWIFKLNR